MDFDNQKAVEKQSISCIHLTDISKNYGVTKALAQFNLLAYPKEIIGLVGPNGAGKSTLMKVLTGVTSATGGSININNNEIPTCDYNTTIARKNGIACAYQDLSLCSNLNVYENFMITLGDHKIRGEKNWRKKIIRFTKDALDQVFPDNNIQIHKSVSSLSAAQQQMVEIARAMAYPDLKILILDEPTSSLMSDRIQQLHTAMKNCSAKGTAIIYISHKIEEIKQISSKIVIMKNGSNTFECCTNDINTEELVDKLGGNIVKQEKTKTAVDSSENIIEINNLSTSVLKNINIQIKAGEIVGIAGLGGSGQKELLTEIFQAGMGRKSSCVKVKKKVAYISGDRQNEGVFRLWDIASNITISSLDLLTRWRLISRKKSDELAQDWYDKLKFTACGKNSSILDLSGGNQQKALIARGIASESDIIILDDPTRGVDVETKKEIYRLLDEVKKSGKCIIWNSTEDLEMEECDRVYVMHSGTVVQELKGNEISVENVVGAYFKGKDSETVQSAKSQTVSRSSVSRNLKSLYSSRAFIPIVVFLAIFITNGCLNNNSVSYMGINYLLGAAVPFVLAAIAQMLIVLAGDIDLGLGSAIGLINVLTATVLVQNFWLGILVYVLFVIAYTAMGALIHIRRLPAIVVSLGASFIWLGIALMIQDTPGGASPEWLSAFMSFEPNLIPMPIYLCLIAGFVSFWIVKKSKYGIVLRGIGNNPKAITRGGWSYFASHITIYAIASLFIIFAGISVTGYSMGSDANGTSSFTMMSIATIILGGCEFSGGIAEPVGVVIGALAISLISSLLAFLNVSSNFQTAVVGCILLAALAFKLLMRRKENEL